MDRDTIQIHTTNEENDPELWTLFPVEIVDQFLLHLPVKSLLRFRAVCKRWKVMITDPRFAKKHLQTSVASDRLCSLVTRTNNHGVCEFGYASNNSIFSNPNNFEFVNLSCPFVEDEERYMTYARVPASCDGLLLLQIGDYEHYVWNPSTREIRKLPSVPWNRMYQKFVYRSAALAYDEVNDDYKVAVFFIETQLEEYRALCAIYSLRSNDWTLVDVPDRIDNHTDNVMVLKGAVHWLTREDGTSRLYVVALDLASGRIREMALPDYGPNGVRDQRLWIFEGCLCVIALGNYSPNYDLWVMKDYGVLESWTSLFQVPFWSITYFDGRPELFLWDSKYGKLLIWFLRSWILFDTKRQFLTRGSPSPNNSTKPVLSYVESLVSPNRV